MIEQGHGQDLRSNNIETKNSKKSMLLLKI